MKTSATGIVIAIGYFILQCFLVSGAGLSWDEPQNFFNGTKTLQFFLTGNRQYVDTWGDAKLFSGDHMAYMAVDANYPPGAGLVGALFSSILSDRLHITNRIDAFHIGEIAIGAVGIGTFYYLAVLLGLAPLTAAMATILFGLYPTIFGEMRADAKDVPMMSALIVFVYLFFRRGIVSAIALGIAVWMKPTALIILAPIFLWTRKIKLLPLLLAISFAVLYLLWPYVWNDPIAKLQAAWEFFRTVGRGNTVYYLGNIYNAGFNLPWHYPWVILGVQTPIEISLLAIVGAMVTRGKWRFFVLLWFVLGMLRFALPGMVIYAKIRHFIDVMPAFFLLVGFGLQWIRNKKLQFAFFLIVLAHVVWINALFYPYEPSYFNALVGGTKNVAEKRLFDVEHWGTGTREAMQFINSQKSPVSVYGCGLNHVAREYAEPHIDLVNVPQLGTYVLVPNMPTVFHGVLDFYHTNQRLVHTITRAGADLYYVYQITDASRMWICEGEVAVGEE